MKDIFHYYYFMKSNFRIQGIFSFHPLPGLFFSVSDCAKKSMPLRIKFILQDLLDEFRIVGCFVFVVKGEFRGEGIEDRGDGCDGIREE